MRFLRRERLDAFARRAPGSMSTSQFSMIMAKSRLGAVPVVMIAAATLRLQATQLLGFSLVCCGVLLPFNFWAIRVVRRTGALPPLTIPVDVVTTIAIVALAPATAPLVPFFALGQLAISSVVFRPVRALAAAFLQVLGATVVEYLHGGVDWGTVVLFVLLAPPVRAASGLVLAHERLLLQQLHTETTTDALTGLPNRRALRGQFPERLGEAARNGDRLGLLIIGLNGFRDINNTLGHATGDLLLIAAAERLKHGLGDRQLVRLGGDEFAVFNPVESRRMLREDGEYIQQLLDEPFLISGMKLVARATIGMSMYPDDGIESTELWRRADAAMHEAKAQRSSGGFDSTLLTDEDRRSRLMLVGEIPNGLALRQFDLHLQPKLDLASRRVSGAEVLIRWNHPVRGMLTPQEFIELAEVSGLIVPMTKYVIEGAVATLRAWNRPIPTGAATGDDVSIGLQPVDLSTISLAINVSAQDLVHDAFPETVRRLVNSGNIATRLTIELTERELLRDLGTSRAAMDVVRELGCRMSIDDFGTGYSSLGYLHELAIDEVKIDRSFTAKIRTNPAARSVVANVIRLAHDLGMTVVGEGIEHHEEAAILTDLGCEEGQGYLFSPAMSSTDFEHWVTLPARSPEVLG
jgi:diguanylate cyclase (GGDEF)-like protein